MPENVRVLQCFNCKTYQVDLVKKAKNWTCKICNAKQSLRCELYRGSGPDCRKRVQELNKQREQTDSSEIELALEIAEKFEKDLILPADEQHLKQNSYKDEHKEHKEQSKWSKFVERNKVTTNENNHSHWPNSGLQISLQNTQKWENKKSNTIKTMRPCESNIENNNKKTCKWDSYM